MDEKNWKGILCPECGLVHPLHKAGCRVKKLQDRMRVRKDGRTWMVSMIHANVDSDGSTHYAERGGHTPEEAMKSYLADEEVIENLPLECEGDLSLAIFCVVDNVNLVGVKPWKVHLFVLEDGDVKSFP